MTLNLDPRKICSARNRTSLTRGRGYKMTWLVYRATNFEWPHTLKKGGGSGKVLHCFCMCVELVWFSATVPKKATTGDLASRARRRLELAKLDRNGGLKLCCR